MCSLFWNIFYVNLRIMCMLQLLGDVFCKCQLLQVRWYIVQSLLKLDFLSSSSNYWEWGIEVSNYYHQIVCFSFWLCQFLVCVLWSSVIRCVNIYNCYILLCIDSFIIMKCSSLSLVNNFVSISAWSDLSTATPALQWLLYACYMHIYCHPFTFILFMLWI